MYSAYSTASFDIIDLPGTDSSHCLHFYALSAFARKTLDAGNELVCQGSDQVSERTFKDHKYLLAVQKVQHHVSDGAASCKLRQLLIPDQFLLQKLFHVIQTQNPVKEAKLWSKKALNTSRTICAKSERLDIRICDQE